MFQVQFTDCTLDFASFSYKKMPKGVSLENVKDNERQESIQMQQGMFTYLLRKSNDYSVIQNKQLGPFTQGAGLHYQEDYDNFYNFKLAQHFLDVFRKKQNKKYPVKRKKRQTPIPLALDHSIQFIVPKNKMKIS